MMKPAIPADESQRLQTLRDMRLLDTPPEERFDRVTRLAKQVFGTPYALVSLVDADRQWFKSRQGLDAEETPREVSFCGHAILDEKIMVVNDAANDSRFSDNPLVCSDPNIRFYAGYPLAAPDGSRVGTLCVVDHEPREVSQEQLVLLRELGRMVEEEMISANDSTTDVVTGISNRNGFLTVADHLLALCKRKRDPATLLLFHLYDLYSLEETHGRYDGDTVALELSRLLMAEFRESDIVARTSLDTFSVLLATTDLDGAAEARSRFAEKLGARNGDVSRRHALNVAVHSVVFDAERHAKAEMLLNEGDVQIGEAYEQNQAIAEESTAPTTGYAL